MCGREREWIGALTISGLLNWASSTRLIKSDPFVPKQRYIPHESTCTRNR